MFENGNILHITKYQFDNGEIKNTGKFLIVILNERNRTIVASLTSSQDHVPDVIKKSGCININQMSISCYFFSKGKEITTILCE